MSLPAPVLVASRQEDNTVWLEWTGAENASSVLINRNGVNIDVVGPGVTNFTDQSAPAAETTYDLTARFANVNSNAATVEAVTAPPPPSLIKWFLVNPNTDTRVGPIFSGATVQKPFALEATMSGASSIRFSGGVSRNENSAPFAPGGDQNGNFAPINSANGPLTIRAEAFTADNAGGTKLADESITLTVTDVQPEPEPNDPPVLVATRDSDESVRLSWTGAEDADSFEVLRGTALIATLGAGVVSYHDQSAPSGATNYTVSALYGTDKASDSASVPAVQSPPDPTPGDAWALIPADVREWVKPPSGWKRLGLDLFDRPIAQGQWGKKGGPEEFPKMTEGPVLWRGTAQADDEGNDSSDRGFYDAPNTCWVEGHEMKEHIRFGKPGVIPFKHDPTGKPLVNRPLLVGPGHTPSYSDITRWPAACIDLYAQYPGGFIESFKCAHLFWGSAKINQAGYQEYDCPEFKFGDGLRGNAFFHNAGTVGGQDSKRLNIDTTKFHHYRLLFQAKGYKGHPTGVAEAWIDGNLVLRKTTNIGTGECYYAKQTETYLKGQAIAGEAGGPPLNAQGPQGIIKTRLFQISVPN